MKPVLFIDFDRTLFDTDQFYEWLGPNRFERILALTSGELSHPNFAEYLYADTINFLTLVRQTHRVVIVTYAMNLALQRKKIRGTNIVSFVDDVIITGRNKGEEITEYLSRIGDPGWEHTFVDDLPQNIDDVKRLHPEVRCIRIDRVPLAQELKRDDILQEDAIVTNLSDLRTIL